MLPLAARIINYHNCVLRRREHAAEESHVSKERKEHKMAEMVTTKPAHCEVKNAIVL